jgi:Catechol dioxygenase N terminus
VNNFSSHGTILSDASIFFEPEFILLSDVLGVSILIDSLNNAKPPGATESTVLGPFFTEDTHDGTLVILYVLAASLTLRS